MGCDIDYHLDHDFTNFTPEGFLNEFKKRIAPLEVEFTGWGTSPYTDISQSQIKDGWMFYCYENDYETAFNNGLDFTISRYENSLNRRWEIHVNPKTIELRPYDDELDFSPNYRWRTFEEYYLKKQDKKIEQEIESRIVRLLDEVRKYILPVFHSTKLIAIGDQGGWQEMELDFEAGKTIDEALKNESLLKYYAAIKVCEHGKEETYKINRKELPVWMARF